MLAISNTMATSLCSAALAYRPYPRMGVPFTAHGPDMVTARRPGGATRPATVTRRASHLLHRHVLPHIRQRPDRHHPSVAPAAAMVIAVTYPSFCIIFLLFSCSLRDPPGPARPATSPEGGTGRPARRAGSEASCWQRDRKSVV